MITKILVLESNPQGTQQLRLTQEIRAIENALLRGKNREQFILCPKVAVRVEDLQSHIRQERARIVHFCGHGAGSQGLVLETTSGKQQLLGNKAIADLFRLFQHQVECVVLNACYSQVQAREINQQINYVIGTKQEIRDDAAVAFSTGFYEALGDGEEIERAFEFGCNRIQLEVYGNSKSDSKSNRKLVPVYSDTESEWIELPQHEVIQLLKKEPLNQLELEIEVDREKASATEAIRNITIIGGNYNENIEGDYHQYTETILQRPLINRSPYKGLKKFNAKDKDLFFGRDVLINKLIAAANQSNLVLVLGASGSGKSSVVRAGVIPQIENLPETHFECFLFTPNRNPFVSFHRSLLDPTVDIFRESEVEFVLDRKQNTFQQTANLLKNKHSHWLIFIDQFEELFTICSNLETRRNFIQGIVEIAQDRDNSIKLILAMRSDFLEELSAYPEFTEIAEKKINLVADMQTEELRQAIAKPAAEHGVMFESGLVEKIIEDVLGQAGSLPLLQYTLDLIWQQEELSNRTLNTSTYNRLGGVTGALQKHVNQIYQELTPEQQVATKQIFLRLVDIVGQEKSEVIKTTVSRRAYQSEFTEAQAETVKLLIDNNLLVSDDQTQEGQSTVEIAHEALLTSWVELKDWITDARNTISLRNRLVEDVANWHQLQKTDRKRANEELWSGSRLEKAIESRKDGTFKVVLGGLSDEANNFIDASIEWKDRQVQEKLAAAQKLTEESEARRDAEIKARAEAEQRATEQKQANKKLRVWSIVAATFGIAASFLGITSLYSSQEAQLERRAANIKVKLALSNQIEPLLESLELVGENQKFNQTWLKPQNILLSEVQSVLYQSIEESRERYNSYQLAVSSVSFSPDGKHFASSSWDKTVKLWDVESQSLIHIFNGHQEGVIFVIFSPNGKYLVSGSGDNTIKLWDVESQSLVHTFNGHQDAVSSISFSPNGNYLVSGSDDNTVKLWSVGQQKLIHTFKDHQDEVNSVSFSPNGNYLVSGSDDNTVKLWDVESQSLIDTLNDHQDAVYAVSFSPNGKYLVSGSRDNTVKLWDVESQSLIDTLNGHQDAVSSISFSPNGKYLVSGSWDNTVKLWDVESQSLIDTLNGHQDAVDSVSFSPDGKHLASVSWDEMVKLWDVESQSLIHTFNGHQDQVRSVSFSSDGKHFVSDSDDNTVKLWDVEQQKLIHTFNGHQDRVSSVSFSPNGKYLVSGSGDNTVKLWGVEQKKLIHTFNGHQDQVSSVSFSPKGKYLVTGSDDNTVKLWDVEQQKLIHTFNGHQDRVSSVSFSPNGKYLVSVSWDETLKLWDVKNQELIQTFNNHQQNAVGSVSFSSDGKHFVSDSDDNTVKLWSVEQRELIHTFDGHQSWVGSVSFSHDGKYLVSGSGDNTVKLWSVKQGELIHTFNGHQDAVISVSFSPDGKYFLSGSLDNTVKLWSVEKRELIHTFNAHQDGVISVSFSPDGKYLVSGSSDNTVRLWRGIDWQDWVAVGCERIRLHPALVSQEIDAAPGAANTCLKYGNWTNREKAEFLVKQGLAFAAQEGNTQKANQKFQQAAKLDPDFVNQTKLKREANQLTEQFLRSHSR